MSVIGGIIGGSNPPPPPPQEPPANSGNDPNAGNGNVEASSGSGGANNSAGSGDGGNGSGGQSSSGQGSSGGSQGSSSAGGGSGGAEGGTVGPVNSAPERQAFAPASNGNAGGQQSRSAVGEGRLNGSSASSDTAEPGRATAFRESGAGGRGQLAAVEVPDRMTARYDAASASATLEAQENGPPTAAEARSAAAEAAYKEQQLQTEINKFTGAATASAQTLTNLFS